jgi:hypothetical protein
MTEPQRTLALLLAQGGVRQIDAFRAAYGRDPQDRKPSTYVSATRAAQNHKVQLMATALLGDLDSQGYSNPAKTRAAVLQKLSELAEDPEVPAAVQLQASVWLGKANHVRLFTEQAQSDQNDHNIEDVRAALAEAIRELFTPAPCTTPVIDVHVQASSSADGRETAKSPDDLLERRD